jgi:hypothetical protein
VAPNPKERWAPSEATVTPSARTTALDASTAINGAAHRETMDLGRDDLNDITQFLLG